MKKGLSLILALALCLAILPCAAAETTWYNGLDFSEHVSLEYMGWSNNGIGEDDPFLEKLEEMFNMDLTYTQVPNGQYQDFSSSRLASGDYPEMFKFMVPDVGGLNLYRQFQEDGLIVNISEYAEKYNLTNLQNVFNSAWCQPLREADGSFYQVPNQTGPGMQAMYFRQDWADELGLEQPKNYDEYKAFLKACVEADLDGQGTTGLTCVGIPEDIISAFTGKSGSYVNVDGKWIHECQAPGFMDAIRYLHELYSENLLDPEFALMNNTTIQEKMGSGRASSIILNGTAAWWRPIETSLAAYKPEGILSAFSQWPAGPAGEIRRGGANFYGTVVVSSEASEAQIVRALALMDYTLTEECYDLFYYGVEGKTYSVVDGERVIDLEAKDAYCKGRDVWILYDLINNVMQYDALTIQPLIDNHEWLADHVVFDEVVGLSTDVTIEVGSAIQDVYKTWVTAFITGDKNIDTEWDDFMAEMETAGLSRYLAEVEAYKAQ